MIKIIMTDLDGTLLNSQHEIPSDFYEVYQMMKDKGILFVVASGRQKSQIASIFEPIKDEIGYIAENGSIVHVAGKLIQSRCLDRAIIDRIVANYTASGAYVLTTLDCVYVQEKDRAHQAGLESFYDKVVFVTSFNQVKEAFVNLAIFNTTGVEVNDIEGIRNLNEAVNVLQSANQWVDILDPTIHKGKGVEALSTYLGVQLDEIVVFGDYQNDFEMMSLLPQSYAMSNAIDSIKQVATYILDESNETNGVTKKIRTLLQ